MLSLDEVANCLVFGLHWVGEPTSWGQRATALLCGHSPHSFDGARIGDTIRDRFLKSNLSHVTKTKSLSLNQKIRFALSDLDVDSRTSWF